MKAVNAYDDDERAKAYATLEFPGTYFLGYRDLPRLIAAHVSGRDALDFGCGAGRSTRFLKKLGFQAVGIDIAPSMIELAKEADPGGRYELIADGDFGRFPPGSFDLVLSAFAFDNIADHKQRGALLAGLRRLLRRGGRVVLLDSAAEIYTHEWLSFTTRQFTENRTATSGDAVRIVMTDVADQRPILDFFWTHEDYLRLFDSAGLVLLDSHRPLGRKDEPFPWQTELTVSPWVIYVLGGRGD